jgi:hypothetical protein
LNTAQLKIEWKSKPIAAKNWIFGGQYIQQNAVGNDGNEDQTKVYTQEKSGLMVFSGRLGLT